MAPFLHVLAFFPFPHYIVHMKLKEITVGRLGSKVECYINEDLHRVTGGRSQHPALIIVPGGGYNHVSPREGEPVALRFLSHAVNCFVLHYPVGDDIKEEKPLDTLTALVDELHDNAQLYGIDRSMMAIIGFSAGAHLAASYGTIRKGRHLQAMILGYPVVTSGPEAHRGSFEKLCQSEEETELYSLEKRVDGDTLPSFIFTSADDATVPVENSLLFASSLARNKIPFELHIWQNAKHGTSIGTAEVGTLNEDFAAWCDLARTWLFKVWRYEE